MDAVIANSTTAHTNPAEDSDSDFDANELYQMLTRDASQRHFVLASSLFSPALSRTGRSLFDLKETHEAITQQAGDEEEEDEETVKLCKTVKEGRDRLVGLMHKYNGNLLRAERLREVKDRARAVVKQATEQLSTLRRHMAATLDPPSETDNAADEQVDEAVYCLMTLEESVANRVRTQLYTVEVELKTVAKEARTLSDAYGVLKSTVGHACPVCVAVECDTFCDPCAHAFCGRCLGQADRCFICRTRISRTRPLFFS
jgi:chromosome segregation ATPase